VLRRTHQLDKSEVGHAVPVLVGIRDARLFQEVIALAEDKSASVPNRVAAFITLARVRNPKSVPSYEDFTSGLDARGTPRRECSSMTFHPVPSVTGPVPLPTDYLDQISQLKRRVYSDASESNEIRSAAACM